MDALVYGSIGYDVITYVTHMPEPGRDADVMAEERHLGGEACNVSVALATWGVSVAVAGNRLADDDGGRFTRRRLAEAGVDISRIRLCTRAPTPYCRILVTPEGERFILSYGHRDARFTLPDNNLLRSVKLLITDRFGGKVRDALVNLAALAGAAVISNDVASPEEPRLRNSDIVIVSRQFVAHSVGEPDFRSFARALQNVNQGVVIVTRGPDPVLVIGREGKDFEVPVPQAPEVVDTTGAGDLFTAGVAYGFLHDWELEKSVRFAATAASLSVGRRGADNPPRLAEIIERLSTDRE